jgi:hypothetical protein
MSAGLAYDLRECSGCGMLYDHEFAEGFDTLCAECKVRPQGTDSDPDGGER